LGHSSRQDDIELFNGITSDLFPKVVLPVVDLGALLETLKEELVGPMKLQEVDEFLLKCIQVIRPPLLAAVMVVETRLCKRSIRKKFLLQPHLVNGLGKAVLCHFFQMYDVTILRHGLMLVGPTGGGKTSNYNCLKVCLAADQVWLTSCLMYWVGLGIF
jgi:dynein heavy chain